MHRCLQVAELTRRIAEACTPDYKDASLRAEHAPNFDALCALARTCRTLQKPALDVIWWYQFGLYHLLECMPEDLWETEYEEEDEEEEYTGPSSRRLCFLRDVEPDDWARFDFYAARVRKLEYYQGHAADFEFEYSEPMEAVYQALRNRGNPILPNIQEIIWVSNSLGRIGFSFRFLQCHLSSTVTSITLCSRRVGDAEKREFYEAMDLLPLSCPGLKNLRLDVPGQTLDMETLSSLLRRCATLDRVVLHVGMEDGSTGYIVDTSLLFQATQLPKLCELRLDGGASYPTQKKEKSGMAAHVLQFPHLNILSLRTDDAESVDSILNQSSFPSLKELYISSTTPDPDSALELPRLLHRQVGHDTLEELWLSSDTRTSTTELYGSTVIQSSALLPLTSFHNLRIVQLRPGFGISLNDADLKTFASAWLRLHTLTIIGDWKNEQGARISRPTYKGIAHLVRLCPELSSVGLVISPNPPHAESWVLDDLPVSSHRMRLDFAHTKADDLEVMGSWIGKMFPKGVEIWHTTLKEGFIGGSWMVGSRWSELQSVSGRRGQ